MIHIRSTEKNHISHVTRHKRRLLWILIISLAVLWMATACETAPEHPAAGDTTPSAEATNAYPDTETTGNPDTAQTEKPSQTAPQTTAPADTQDPVMELTPEQIRDEILTWDGVADFQDGTITFAYSNITYEVDLATFGDLIQTLQSEENRRIAETVHQIEVGPSTLNVVYDTYGQCCLSAITAWGQTLSFADEPLQIYGNFTFRLLNINRTGMTVFGYGYYCCDWWFLTENGCETIVGSTVPKEEEYTSCIYYFSANDFGELGYIRRPRKYAIIHTIDSISDVSSRDELYSEYGWVSFSDSGEPIYHPTRTVTISEAFDLEDLWQKCREELWAADYKTLDEMMAANAANKGIVY